MHSLKIVVADDEPIIRMDLKEILQEAGQQVVGEASNGLQALEIARRLRPDLVIMDIKMPKMDGLKSAKLITGEKIAPVILLSALSQEEVVKQASQNGAIGYLVKPVEPKNLIVSLQMAYTAQRELNQLKARVAELQEDIQTRKIVEKAKGVLMKQEGLAENEAMNNMQKMSMSKGIPIKFVAQKVIAAYAGKNSIN